ncbi:MAG: endonuclease/exonuclease/phosphatase family protein [Akkermansiaceae bacterium]
MPTRILAFFLSAALLTNAEPTSADPHPKTLRVMAYNIWYVFAKGKAQAEGKQWVASQTPDVVALQELTDIQPEKLQELATAWNHPHSALLKTKGFSVGLTSRLSIEVVEKKVQGMHHGFLHATVEDIHYFIVHLSPFHWEVRSREARTLLERIKPLLDQNKDVIVLGDFNACSSADRTWLEQNKTLLEKITASDQKYEHHQNLREGRFDYSVMQQFFDAGLTDTTLAFLPEKASHRLSYPSGILKNEKTAPEQGERIDFILTGRSLADKVERSTIVTDGIVNQLSDHYPVITDFKMESGK